VHVAAMGGVSGVAWPWNGATESAGRLCRTASDAAVQARRRIVGQMDSEQLVADVVV
jgi:hypothetical protein